MYAWSNCISTAGGCSNDRTLMLHIPLLRGLEFKQSSYVMTQIQVSLNQWIISSSQYVIGNLRRNQEAKVKNLTEKGGTRGSGMIAQRRNWSWNKKIFGNVLWKRLREWVICERIGSQEEKGNGARPLIDCHGLGLRALTRDREVPVRSEGNVHTQDHRLYGNALTRGRLLDRFRQRGSGLPPQEERFKDSHFHIKLPLRRILGHPCPNLNIPITFPIFKKPVKHMRTLDITRTLLVPRATDFIALIRLHKEHHLRPGVREHQSFNNRTGNKPLRVAHPNLETRPGLA